jgi:fatty acid desaturase
MEAISSRLDVNGAALAHFTRRDISEEKKRIVRELHRINPWWNLKTVAFLIIWVGCGFLAVNVDSLFVRLACYFAMGATLQGLVILLHEGVHHIMFENKFLNRWVAFLCGVPALLSVTAYRVGHLPHHRYEREEGDPDELENFSRNPRKLTFLFCLTFFFGELFGAYRVGVLNVLRARAQERREILVEYALVAGIVALAIAFVPFQVLLHVWIFPALFARQLTNIRTLAEHSLTGRGNSLAATRTVVSNPLVSFFMCNLNYHIEHHLFMAIPWYNLRKLHRLLQDEYKTTNAQVYKSYTRFLIDLGKFIVHAWRPGGKNIPLCLPTA